MRFFYYIFLCNLMLCGAASSSDVQAQVAKNTVSGYIRDAESGETLIGVAVYAPRYAQGTSSNAYGFYSLTLPADTVTLRVSYIGYQTFTEKIDLRKAQTLNINLQPESAELEEVVIKADNYQEQVRSTQMSVNKLTMQDAKMLPALFGEVDIIKTLQLKPGVTNAGEGSSGIYVRGGGPDQNLVLLDEAQVYNPSHLFGFFSSFNSDAVKSVELFKGGFPAEYGGKLSSVLDVKLNEGNDKRWAGSGGIGSVASRFTLEGPIVKGKSSFIVSARRTYVDLLTRAINKANEDKEDDEDYVPIPNYYFYDLNIKTHYDFSEKDKLYASAFFSRDVFTFALQDLRFKFSWGNRAATLRWNHVFNPKLFLNTTLTYSGYDYEIDNKFGDFSFLLGSGIKDIALKTDFLYAPSAKHTVKFGAVANHRIFDVSRLSTDSPNDEFEVDLGETLDAQEYGVYVSDDIVLSSRVQLNTGLRLSGFSNDGEFYTGAEPRFSLRYSLSENVSLKAAYTQMYQYVHLVANSAASLPTDVWYPSTQKVKPQNSRQVGLGITWKINDNWLFTNEPYYKWLDRQVDFRDGAQLFVNENLEEEFVFGKGYAYGNEIYLERTAGKLRGWVGYTWSQSWREFEDINSGKRFHPRNDRTHDLSVVVMYELNKRLTLTGTFVYNTGTAYSLPTGRYYLQDPLAANPAGSDYTLPISVVPVYEGRNTFRLPAYHRMDLGLVWKQNTKKFQSDLTLSIYNAYNRRNPYFIFFKEKTREVEVNGETKLERVGFTPTQVSLFPIIPAVTYNFKF